jgi:2'-5' RNA ligase
VRLFLAVNLPEAEIPRLTHALQSLPVGDLPVRWVASNSLHITMKFLGEVPTARLSAVAEALQQGCAGAAAVDVAISGLSAFPSLARPNIFWVGVQAGPQLAELHGRIQRSFVPLGFEAETRAFKPHITVARVRKDGRIRDRQAMDRIKAAFDYKMEFRAKSVDLMRSHLGRGGARYEVLEQVGLY